MTSTLAKKRNKKPPISAIYRFREDNYSAYYALICAFHLCNCDPESTFLILSWNPLKDSDFYMDILSSLLSVSALIWGSNSNSCTQVDNRDLPPPDKLAIAYKTVCDFEKKPGVLNWKNKSETYKFLKAANMLIGLLVVKHQEYVHYDSLTITELSVPVCGCKCCLPSGWTDNAHGSGVILP